MTAKTFFNRYVLRTITMLACLFTGVVCTYARYIQKARVVYGDKELYFLVDKRENVEVGAHFVEQLGGAGNVLTLNKRDYAVFSVYSSLTDGEQAQTSVCDSGEDATLLRIRVGDMYFKTRQEKAKSTIVVSGLELCYQNICILESVVARLDKGMTQESVKRLLQISKQQFAFMSKEYAYSYPQLARVCNKTEKALEEYQTRIVQSKDLRAELCIVCADYLALRSEFSL